MSLVGALLAVSSLLQVLAAVMAFRLVSVTRHRLAWLCIAAAILLMGLLLVLAAFGVVPGDETGLPGVTVALLALMVSALMVIGVGRIAPRFIDLERSETALRNSQQQLQAILDHTGTAVYAKDLEGRFLLVNNKGLTILGRTQDEVRGKTDFDLFPHEIAAAMRESDRQVEVLQRSIELDEKVVHADGSEHRYLSVKFPLLDSKGKMYGVCGISTDITERVRVAEEQRAFESKLQAAQKLESLGVLAGGIAHDFNNLLVGILGNADLALDTPGLDDDARESLRDIQSAAEAAGGLCKQLLAYSGRAQLQLAPVDVSALVNTITRLVAVSAAKKARFECDLAPRLPMIEADSTQVVQVLMNLLTNASEAIVEPAGTISLKTRLVEHVGGKLEHQVVGAELGPGRYVCIEVEDSGVGMSEETMRRLFEPFYTTKFTGRGLGLAAVAGIMRGHEGAMTLESRQGKGTRFTALFPVSEQELALPGPEPRLASNAAAGRVVLVVDDEAVVRKLAKRALERAGFEVLLAADGPTALELFRSHAEAVQLVLLDLTMPEMDGEQTFEALKAIDPKVNVVLASGYDEASMTRRSFAAATSGFLAKPFTAKELEDCARRALTRGATI